MVNEANSVGRRPLKQPSERGGDDLYPFNSVDFTEKDVRGRYESVMGPLSLFSSQTHDDSKENKVELERPITPIDDEIKAPPMTFQKLAKLARRRISAKPNKEHISIDDQKELGAVIMGELNGIWSDIRQQVEDPFLSASENKELQRRITVHVVTVCEHLFLHYADKAQILNRRGVFSGPANMSRLKAQLALDANKFLNILTIRRYIVGDMRHKDDDDFQVPDPKKSAIPEQPATKLSYKGFLEASRPKSKSRRLKTLTLDEEMQKMTDNMPTLDATKLVPLIADLPHERSTSQISAQSSDYFSIARRNVERYHAEKAALQQKQLLQEAAAKKQSQVLKEKVLFRKCDSVPMLAVGENLLEELGVETDRKSAMSMNDIEHEEQDTTDRRQTVSKDKAPEPGTREYAYADLQRLVKPADDGADKEDDEDLPPLLQALTMSAKHDGKRQWIDQQLKDLEKREEKRRIEESIVIKEPKHPQPATVTNKMPNKMVVRTSDIRVSERVCLSSITLNKNATVYNDLVDEIDPVTVKQLDSNLFLGNEINEVYKEIMKTVPSDHLDLEDDGFIEPTADIVNLSSALASSTLSKKREDRVINPELHKDLGPPWGEQPVSEWVKTPVSPPKDFRGRPTIQPMSPRGTTNEWTDLLGSKAEQYMPKPPDEKEEKNAMQEFYARTYASWLSWWKNTVNSDDYMKYLSTQESDYMGVIFHFYNSDDEEEEEDLRCPTKSTRRTVRQMEEQKSKKLQEIRAIKTEFKEGFWNANSVFLGGLGRDPELEDDNSDQMSKAPSTSDTESKMVRSRSMLVSRKSSRQQGSEASPRGKMREGATSRFTQQTGDQATTEKAKTEEIPPNNGPQNRLEKVWNTLLMPDGQRLDMAIKYSSDDWHSKLDEAIDEWEDASDLIVAREELIAKLERFERLASDPNRFFEKGQRGSSVARLQESRIRSSYYKKIEGIDEDLKIKLQSIKKQFQDDVTFQGRPYMDKMHWDRTEMLYWLQEERKQQAIEYESKMRNLPQLPLHMARLDPITPVM